MAALPVEGGVARVLRTFARATTGPEGRRMEATSCTRAHARARACSRVQEHVRDHSHEHRFPGCCAPQKVTGGRGSPPACARARVRASGSVTFGMRSEAIFARSGAPSARTAAASARAAAASRRALSRSNSSCLMRWLRRARFFCAASSAAGDDPRSASTRRSFAAPFARSPAVAVCSLRSRFAARDISSPTAARARSRALSVKQI